MNIQVLTLLLIILGLITFLPYYLHFRRLGGTRYHVKIWFTVNTFATLMLALFFGLFGFGFFAESIFFIGIGLYLFYWYGYVYNYSLSGLKRGIVIAGAITLCVLLCVITIYYLTCVRSWFTISMDMTGIYPWIECMFLFLVVCQINAFAVLEVHEIQNKHVMQYFMFASLIATIIIIIAFEGFVITKADIDPFSAILFTSMQSPIIGIVIAIIIFGTLVKTLSYSLLNTAAIGNILISWVPTLVWGMIFMSVIPVPTTLNTLFTGFVFFGWFVYLMIVAIVFILMIAVSSFFTNLTERINLG